MGRVAKVAVAAGRAVDTLFKLRCEIIECVMAEQYTDCMNELETNSGVNQSNICNSNAAVDHLRHMLCGLRVDWVVAGRVDVVAGSLVLQYRVGLAAKINLRYHNHWHPKHQSGSRRVIASVVLRVARMKLRL